jgi:hypothetical protein
MKISKKDSEEDIRSWKESPCSWTGRIKYSHCENGCITESNLQIKSHAHITVPISFFAEIEKSENL